MGKQGKVFLLRKIKHIGQSISHCNLFAKFLRYIPQFAKFQRLRKILQDMDVVLLKSQQSLYFL